MKQLRNEHVALAGRSVGDRMRAAVLVMWAGACLVGVECRSRLANLKEVKLSGLKCSHCGAGRRGAH